MEKLFKQIFKQLGYDVHRLNPSKVGTESRPVGNMQMLLEDLKYRGLTCQLILDVGANHGNWSRIAKTVFSSANCFLIEPQIEMQSYLDNFCKEFPGSNWFLVGVGASPSEMTLTIWDDLVGSSLLPSESEELKVSGKQRKIQIVTIDSLIKNNLKQIPQLVKLDIQGFELEALRGGTMLFGSTEVFILEVSLFKFLEDQPIFHEIITFMAERGYLVYDFPGFLRRPYDGALGQVDVCFVKQDGLLHKENRWL
ncbi:MAG: FkbM family methyltransferase [Hassallia sp. WJT32-NPBG1]|jgi:FkbM family methyltransferase|nr:FkbM family methyltransferase [Hassallia sp. WJT32-NPBG1]